MFGLGPMEVVIILVIALVVFGPGKLPEMGSALGKSLGEFRKATKEITEPLNEIKEPFNELKSAVSLTESEKKKGDEAENKGAAATTVVAAAGVVCPHCQAANEPKSKFCGGCGAVLT